MSYKGHKNLETVTLWCLGGIPAKILSEQALNISFTEGEKLCKVLASQILPSCAGLSFTSCVYFYFCLAPTQPYTPTQSHMETLTLLELHQLIHPSSGTKFTGTTSN